MYRWFSGKFDSVKQKYVSNKFDANITSRQDELYRMYTASLRLEMLFYGMVVVTDSQWYDGRYFARLSEHEFDFYHFKRLVDNVDNPVFQIKRDPNYFNRIFSRPFEFSSLTGEVNGLSPQVDYIMKFAKEKYDDIKKIAGSFEGYFDLLRIDMPREFSEEFERFERQIKKLDSMPENVYSNWVTIKQPHSYVYQAFHGIRTDGTGRSNIQFIIEDYLNHWCDDASIGDTAILHSFADKIKIAIQDDNPKRAEIKNLIDSSAKIRVDPLHDELLDFINFLFNHAFARQHQSELFDAVDISSMYVQDKEIEIRVMQLNIAFFYCICKTSWEDFSSFLKIPYIKTARENWLSQYRKCQNNPNVDERVRALENLEKYIDIIQMHFNSPSLESYRDEYRYAVESGEVLVAGSSSTKVLTDVECSCLFSMKNDDELRRCSFTVDQDPEDLQLGTISAMASTAIGANQ